MIQPIRAKASLYLPHLLGVLRDESSAESHQHAHRDPAHRDGEEWRHAQQTRRHCDLGDIYFYNIGLLLLFMRRQLRIKDVTSNF